MTVRAKFSVTSVQRFAHGHDEVELNAVTGGPGEDDPNESWSKYTPSGTIRMTITNPAAVDYFKPGDEYFIDFLKAE